MRPSFTLPMILVAATLAGCVRYVIDPHALQAAKQQSLAGPRRVAVPAERVDGDPVYVRYDALDLGSVRPLGATHVSATARYRRGYRVGGPVLIALGSAAMIAAIGITSWDFTSPTCVHHVCDGGGATLFGAAPLAVISIALGISGGLVTSKGFGDPSEVVPPERNLVYLPR